jgi:predicted HTH domain antitoxin
MSLIIDDEVLHSAHMSAREMKREIAVLLFEQERLTLAQASRLAEMPQWQFQALLASRGIPIHYDVDDFDADLRTLRNLVIETVGE